LNIAALPVEKSAGAEHAFINSAADSLCVLIFDSAFTTKAAGGGFAGSTMMIAARYGIARGLFSNESGLGSAPIVAAAAQTRNPVRQTLFSLK
jgi:Na+/alanine symporter